MTNAYEALVAKVTEYLSRPSMLNADLDAEKYAINVIADTEIVDGDLSFEIPAKHTPSKAPNAVSFDAREYAATQE